jgi:FkbM family methyltransferase
MLHTFVGEDRGAVREMVRGPLSDYLKSSVDLMRSMASSLGKDIDSQAFGENDLQVVLGHAFDRYFETSGLFGTPNDCLHMIERLKTIGVDEVACLMDFGVETESVLASLRHLEVVRRRSGSMEQAAAESISLPAQIAKHQVTHLQCTPSMARILKADPDFARAAHSLDKLLLGGEALPVALANELRRDLPAEIINMYGPTETTIWSSAFAIETPSSKIPIGKPVVNTNMFILDKSLEPVPIGAPGALYIGGAGVARGYLNRPELSSERFIPDPFEPYGGGRLYRTGDRARRLEDGDIEFLGRDDYQVKLDGYRIEPGEIEASLTRYDGVREAVVTVHEDAAQVKRLVAYIVTDQSSQPEISRVISPAERQRLLAGRQTFKLPNGMVIAHLGDYQTNIGYREVFGDEVYLKHAITLNDGACIFDVGANIGFFSLFANRKYKDLRVFAFEPIPATFDVLQTNMALHGLNAKLYNCGLSNKAGEAEFTFYPSMAGLSGRYSDVERDKKATAAIIQDWLKKNAADTAKNLLTQDELDLVMEERFKSEKHFCQLRTVSEIIRENNIERIDLLKIDVERSEYDVLCGIEYDDWEKIRQIVIEVDTRENLDRITALLESRDYQVVVEDYVNVEAEDENSEVDVFMLYARQKSAEWRQPVARSVGKLAPEKTSISIDGLRGFLKQSLPEYMIPSSFMFLDELPLTPNGKVDRKSLPEPETLRPELETPYLAPQTAAERTIAAIWQEALGIERVGIHDNFFEVGGTSILLVQVNSRLRESFKTNIPMVEMFRHSSISSMVKYLTRKQNDHTSLQQIHNRAIKQTDTTNLKNQFRKARQRKKTADSQ